ncbi:MAG: hypothetical protein EOO98_03090 [Pedobacter sp.]|nr:MAG: hypothetical protein EOO98_03090 [Pedobacter sp.]
MNKLIMLCFCIFFVCSSCGSISKSNKSMHVNQELSLENKEEKEINLRSVLLIRDSIEKDVITEIRPVGAFRYSNAEGFSGQATYIKIGAKIKKHMHLSNSIHDQSITSSNSHINAKAIAKKTEAKTNKTGGKRIYSIAVLLLIGLGFVYSG